MPEYILYCPHRTYGLSHMTLWQRNIKVPISHFLIAKGQRSSCNKKNIYIWTAWTPWCFKIAGAGSLKARQLSRKLSTSQLLLTVEGWLGFDEVLMSFLTSDFNSEPRCLAPESHYSLIEVIDKLDMNSEQHSSPQLIYCSSNNSMSCLQASTM